MQSPVNQTPAAPSALEGTRETVVSWGETFISSFHEAFGQIIQFLPNIVGMVVVLVAGYVVARMLGRLSAMVAERVGLQTAADRGGLVASMKQVGIDRTVPSVIGQIVFWLTMSFFLMAGFNILGLEAVSGVMRSVVAYIPNLLVATLVIVIGLLVATFLRNVIATSADRVGITYARYLADGCYYVLALITFIAAFNKLGVEFALLNDIILIAFAGLALGFGLSFGLGGRDVMGGILAGYYTRQRLHAGDRVEVGGLHGTVREVGAVATIIETDEDGLLNRRSVPNTKMLNEAVR